MGRDRRDLDRRHSAYERQPDRVGPSLWARAGGSTVRFSFTPRLAGKVVSTPSQIYDYYNPQARLVLPPHRFVV